MIFQMSNAIITKSHISSDFLAFEAKKGQFWDI